MNSKEPVNASDVGLYTFCPQAWAYKRQGCAPCNRDALIRGSQYHEKVGRQLHFSQILQTVLLILIILVLFFLLLRYGGVL